MGDSIGGVAWLNPQRGRPVTDYEGAPENAVRGENVVLRENRGLVEKSGLRGSAELREKLENPAIRAYEGKSEHAGQPDQR